MSRFSDNDLEHFSVKPEEGGALPVCALLCMGTGVVTVREGLMGSA